MKIEKVVTISHPIVDRQRGAHNRPVRLILGQRAECGTILKEQRNVLYILYKKIVLNSVRIIEMKRVVKMIRISNGGDNNKNKQVNNGPAFCQSPE
jgi:hypothetical protein